ncbi:hypothetical protein vseg_001770 [Gypsophila vaccaria]
MNDLRTMLIGMQKSQEYLIVQVAKMDQEKFSAIKSIETQVAQFADAQAQTQQGRLSTQPNNPNANVHHAMAIKLRSRTIYAPPMMLDCSPEVEDILEEDELHGAKDALAGPALVAKKV